MHTFDAITVNNTSIKVDNPTDYWLDQWLCTDYGFRLCYRPKRGTEELYWNKLLKANEFETPSFLTLERSVHYVSTYNKCLDFYEFLSRTFCLEWISGSKPYAMLFDHKTWTITLSDTETFWDII